MEHTSMCRICLVKNIRMKSLANTHLQEIYQNLALIPLKTEDTRPLHACYICCARLQNCYKLRQNIIRSEEFFSKVLENNVPPHFEDIHKTTLSVTEVVSLCTRQEEQRRLMDFEVICTEEKRDGCFKVKMECPEATVEPMQDSNSCFIYKENDISIKMEKIDDCTELMYTNQSSSHYTNQSSLEEQVKPQVLTSIKDNNEIKVEFVKPKYEIDIPIENYILPTESKTNLNELNTNSNNSTVEKLNSQKPYQCNVCQKWCPTRGDLTKHMRTHTDFKIHECSVCKKNFKFKSQLDAHTKIHIGEKPYQCDICSKSFLHKNHLDIHNRIHTGEKPYKCSSCEKCFTVKSHLTIHIRRYHSHERPFQCKVCKKCFKDTSGLNAHTIIHTGEKPHECSICKKSFNSNGNLNKHMKTHTMEKPYQCDICKKCFAQKVQMSNHIRIHTGERPYECSVCTKSFITNSHLTSHMRTHTGEKPYQCDSCEKCFGKREGLNKHSMRIHGKKPSKP